MYVASHWSEGRRHHRHRDGLYPSHTGRPAAGRACSRAVGGRRSGSDRRKVAGQFGFEENVSGNFFPLVAYHTLYFVGDVIYDRLLAVVFSFCDVLAAGVVGAGALSDRVAAVAALPNRWNRCPWRSRPGLGRSDVSRPLAERTVPLIARLGSRMLWPRGSRVARPYVTLQKLKASLGRVAPNRLIVESVANCRIDLDLVGDSLLLHQPLQFVCFLNGYGRIGFAMQDQHGTEAPHEEIHFPGHASKELDDRFHPRV